MDWLVPAIVATLTNSAILASVYLYLWLRERDGSLGLLFLSWSIYALRFVFMLLNVRSPSPLLAAASQLCVVVSSHLILSGFRYWLGLKPFPVVWTVATTVASAWLVVASFLIFDFTTLTIPVFFYSGWIFVWTGILILRRLRNRGAGALIAAVTLIVWGIHKMDYPFLRPVAWVAPWGYLVGGTAAIVTGIAMMLIYFEWTRDELAATVRERETLFREVHHRVKNNLQIVNALLEIQKGPGGGSSHPLAVVQNRISSMALLHEQLYRSGGLASVDSGSYLRDIAERITETLDVGTRRIDVIPTIDSVELPINVAIPFGLITNELVSNAAKHAFSGRTNGTIMVAFTCDASGHLVLTVEDDGTGLDAIPEDQGGVGWQLIRSLVTQLGGAVTLNSTPSSSTRVVITAPNRLTEESSRGAY